MRAILVAAGFGTRLMPITKNIPKCLVPIKGIPLMELWIEKLAKAGVKKILINTHYLAKKVEIFIKKSKGCEFIELVYEKELLGTAGTLTKNIDFYECADGIFMHADNYCNEDLEGLLAAHEERPADCVLTMLTFRTENPSSCGIIEINSRGIAVSFNEKVKNPPGNLANGAIYVLSPRFISEYKELFSQAGDFSLDVLPKYIGRIFTYEVKGEFFDIGTVESYKKANEYIS